MRLIYPGSFDPMTMGHLNLIKRSLKLCDELIILVAVNSNKTPLIPIEKRLELIKKTINNEKIRRVRVETIDGATVDALDLFDAAAIIRGVRDSNDWCDEYRLSIMNQGMYAECETIFIASQPELLYLSSSYVKELIALRKPIENLVPQIFHKFLKDQ